MSRTYYTHIVLWIFRRIINIIISLSNTHSNPIRPSPLACLATNIYILSPYIHIYFLASYFIYYTYIDIASISILTIIITSLGHRHPHYHYFAPPSLLLSFRIIFLSYSPPNMGNNLYYEIPLHIPEIS